MGKEALERFMEQYTKDTEEFRRKFLSLDQRLGDLDQRFDSLDQSMEKLDHKLTELEQMQEGILKNFTAFHGKPEQLQVFLSRLEDKLNEYESLKILGEMRANGELLMLKIEMLKVKPMIHWENDQCLLSRYREAENRFQSLEQTNAG